MEKKYDAQALNIGTLSQTLGFIALGFSKKENYLFCITVI